MCLSVCVCDKVSVCDTNTYSSSCFKIHKKKFTKKETLKNSDKKNIEAYLVRVKQVACCTDFALVEVSSRISPASNSKQH